MSNTTQFKQILVDVDNYNALKELGKTGDSFNIVIRNLLNKAKNYRQYSTQERRTKDFIEIKPDNKSFILKINPGLRRVGINSITAFKNHLEIEFLDENGVTVDYPKDLLEISIEVESALLNSNMRLPNYAVKRIVDYFEEHVYQIEACITEIT